MKDSAALFDGLDRGTGQGDGVAVPLLGEPRLDDRAAPFGVRNLVGVRLSGGEKAETIEFGEYGAARLLAREACEAVHEGGIGEALDSAKFGFDLAESDVGAGVEDARHRQVMALAHGEVVEIVRGRDFDRTGALLGIGVRIGDDGDDAAGERQHDAASDEVGVAGIVGVNGHCGVGEHGFRPGGGDGERAAVAPFNRVGDLPEVATDLAAFDFEVGDGRAGHRIPVHQTACAGDETLLVERDENLANSARQALVHGEALARPVERGA